MDCYIVDDRLQFSANHSTPNDLPPVVIGSPDLPLFSIVTPSYNQGQYIRATIESVLTQDYPNIEYWMIDGGSTDETLSILQEYEHDPRFHWLSEKDHGQSDAINKGLARCRGQLFVWLNSDDLLAEGALRHVASAARTLNAPAIIYGLGRLIDQAGNDLGYCSNQSSNMTLEKLLRFVKYHLVQPATFAPTDCVREVGGLNPALHFGMDLDLWIRLAERIPITFVPHDIALCRLHPAAKTVALATRFIDDVAAISTWAVQRGLLSEEQARGRTSLLAARTYLMPQVKDLRSALRSLETAIRADYSLLPEATLGVLRALGRLAIGEERWAKARHVWAKMPARWEIKP